MANGGKDNGRFRTATLVNWHLLPEVELTPGGFAKMQAAPWPEGVDTMVRFKDALSCDFREAQGLHFYSDDYQFERIWTKPEVYLELLEQFAFVVEPDFSMYLDFPEPLQKWNHYRNQLLGAWWQARGLNVIPSASWADKASFAWTFEGLPEHSTVAISTVGCVKGHELYGYFMDGVHELFRQKQPTGLLVYGKLTPDIEQVCKDAGIKYKNFPHTMMGARFLTKQYAGKLAQADKRRSRRYKKPVTFAPKNHDTMNPVTNWEGRSWAEGHWEHSRACGRLPQRKRRKPHCGTTRKQPPTLPTTS